MESREGVSNGGAACFAMETAGARVRMSVSCSTLYNGRLLVPMALVMQAR